MNRFSETDIIYEDADLLVCRKHAGMAVQSARISEMDLESALRIYRKGAYVGLVQRLDQPVEGLLVVAKNRKAAAALCAQHDKGRMSKEYAAVFTGEGGRGQGRLEDYLAGEAGANRSRIVPEGSPGAKRAALTYRVLETWSRSEVLARLRALDAEGTAPAAGVERDVPGGADVGLAHIVLETVRRHQIRVQMARAGMPLWADAKYHAPLPPEEKGQPVALCACRLAFDHPRTGKRMCFSLEPEGKIFRALRASNFGLFDAGISMITKS